MKKIVLYATNKWHCRNSDIGYCKATNDIKKRVETAASNDSRCLYASKCCPKSRKPSKPSDRFAKGQNCKVVFNEQFLVCVII